MIIVRKIRGELREVELTKTEWNASDRIDAWQTDSDDPDIRRSVNSPDFPAPSPRLKTKYRRFR